MRALPEAEAAHFLTLDRADSPDFLLREPERSQLADPACSGAGGAYRVSQNLAP
jgi:hypothetical protein